MKLIDIEKDKIYKKIDQDVFLKYNYWGEIVCSSYPDDWKNYFTVTNIETLLETNVIEFKPANWEIKNNSDDLKIVIKQADNIVRLNLNDLEKLCVDVANEKDAPF